MMFIARLLMAMSLVFALTPLPLRRRPVAIQLASSLLEWQVR